MNIKNLQKFLFIFMLISTLLLTACGGGGGGSTGAKDDLNKFNTISKTIDSNVVSSVGNLTTNGIQLNVAKNAIANGSKITIKQYSNIGAASAKLSNEFPQLASFTAVSALYEISAVDSKEKTVTTLDNSSELEIQLQEDISSDKLYYSAIKQNNEWDLYPLAINDLNATIRAAKESKSVKITINTLYQSLFIACAKKSNIPSKLTYAEVFDLKFNGKNDTPTTISALYTQKFENDIEGKIKLTLKGELTPDKADMNLEVIQKGNKSIYLKKKDNTYKEFTFKTTDEADKYKSKISLTNEFVNTELSGDTAIYTFYVKAKDVKIDDMPSSLIVKAITNGTKPFYSNELQLNFAGGSKQPTASVKGTAPTTEADIKQTIVVAFSEAMNKDAVEKALLIKAGDKNIEAASKSWNKNNTELSIVLQNLSVNTKHSISIGSTALSASGVPLKAFSISFTTKKYLGGNSVTLITPAETTNVNIDTKIVLAFAKPVKFDTSKGSELVTVKTGSTAIGATYTLQNSNKEVVISFNNPLKNSTKYSVSVSDKIPSEDAAYSNVEAKTFEFTTDIKRYTITFNGNGNISGTIPTVKETFVKGESYTIPTSSDVIKTGYCFAGWNTKQDGSGNSYKAGEKLTVSESDIVLYAQWSLYNGGSGTVSDPYKIANATDLYNVRYNLGANFIQIADVDLSSYNSSYICDYDGYSGKGWVPIGEGDTSDKSKYFSGSYDGKGYKIKNLYISRQAGIGLFKQISEKAELANINVEISDDGLSGTGFIGGIAGICLAKSVKGCSVTSKNGMFNGMSAAIGGLFGYSSSNISNCNTRVGIKCSILKSGSDNGGIGGLVGIYTGSNSINDCNTDIVMLSEVDNAGGLIGSSESTGVISKCIASGTIVITGVNAGGLVGSNKSNIDHCIAYSKVASVFAAGGFVGFNTGRISISWTNGDALTISSNSEAGFCGGFAGYNKGSITDCYSEGSAVASTDSTSVSASCVGGFAGCNDSGATLIRCYSKGNAACMHAGAGGIVGFNSGLVVSCVALGEKVLSALTNMQGRITGNNSGSIISSYAIDTMKVGSSVPKVNIGLNLLNGASIKESDAKNPSWWKNTASWSDSTWNFSTTQYPTLNGMPKYN